MTTLNIPNIRTVRGTIAELTPAGNARRLDMTAWFRVLEGEDDRRSSILYSAADLPDPDLAVDPKADCGTAACVAGWTQLALAKTPEEREEPAEDFAERALGLSREGAGALFNGGWSAKTMRDLTAADVVLILDRLCAEGECALWHPYPDAEGR